MAQEAVKQNSNANVSNVEIDKSLINNTFETFKLRHDHIIDTTHSCFLAPTEQKENSTASNRIELPSPHQHIVIEQRIPNLAKLTHILKRNYLFSVHRTLFYYDISGIFMLNEQNVTVQRIYQFDAKAIDVSNLSVCGTYNKQTATYYLMTSHSSNRLTLLQFDAAFKHVDVVFDDKVPEIETAFIAQNACYVAESNRLHCSLLSWQHSKTENGESFNPVLHLLSFDLNKKDKEEASPYRIHAELSGANHFFQCFMDEINHAFWTVSNGTFRCKDTKTGKIQSPAMKKQRLENESVSSSKLGDEIIYGNDQEADSEHANDYADCDWIMMQCFDLNTMDVVHTIDFHECAATKILSINCCAEDAEQTYHENGDRVLCVIGCEFSYDMAVFALLEPTKEKQYVFKHSETFSGLGMVASSRRNRKGILIHPRLQNAFIVEETQYISAFMNPKLSKEAIQDKLQLSYNEVFAGYQIMGDKLYCVSNVAFYKLHLPHTE